MNLKTLAQLFSFRDIRNGLLGLSVVVGGLGLAILTLYAHQSGNNSLVIFSAGASLVFIVLIFVFVIPPLARSASAEASQMNLPFELTIGGAAFLGLIVIVGFAAWNTGNNLLFLVLSLMAAALVVGFISGNNCLKKLDVKMRFPESIYAEESTPILVGLHNRKRVFPTFSVITQVRGKNRETSVVYEELKKIIPERLAKRLMRPPILKHTLDYFVYVPRRAAVENTTEHVFPRRGRFIIKDFELSTRFPFGFFRHRRRLSAQAAEIVIFPKISTIDEEIMDIPLNVGKFVLPKRGLGQDLLALRDYQPLDDLRRVDWKATARTKRLIVREFSAEDDKRVTIIFDRRLSVPTPEKLMTIRAKIEAEQNGENLSPVSDKFESGVIQTASLLAYFAEEQVDFRLITDDKTGEFGSGKEHLNENLRRMALIEPDLDGNPDFISKLLEDVLVESKNSYTFFVTSQKEGNLPEEFLQSAKILKF